MKGAELIFFSAEKDDQWFYRLVHRLFIKIIDHTSNFHFSRSTVQAIYYLPYRPIRRGESKHPGVGRIDQYGPSGVSRLQVPSCQQPDLIDPDIIPISEFFLHMEFGLPATISINSLRIIHVVGCRRRAAETNYVNARNSSYFVHESFIPAELAIFKGRVDKQDRFFIEACTFMQHIADLFGDYKRCNHENLCQDKL